MKIQNDNVNISVNLDSREFASFLEDSDLMEDPLTCFRTLAGEGIIEQSEVEKYVYKVKKLRDDIMEFMDELGDEYEVNQDSSNYYGDVWNKMSRDEKKEVVNMVNNANIRSLK